MCLCVFVCVCLCGAGDLEDVLCTISWPLFCYLCGLRSPFGRQYPSPTCVLFTALTLTFIAVLALALVLMIALPETVLELARVLCMEGLTVVEG